MKISQTDLISFVPLLSKKGQKILLHVGCGTSPASRLPECFKTNEWRELRLDIDPGVKPHIVASLTNMHMVDSQSIDAVWSSHNIEHLNSFEVPNAFAEIRRVLKPGGFALITLPDLANIARLIIEDRCDEVIYTSPAGPITALDMLFGHQKSIKNGKHHMAHRTGFTAKRLVRLLSEAGFDDVRVTRGKNHDLWGIAVLRE